MGLISLEFVLYLYQFVKAIAITDTEVIFGHTACCCVLSLVWNRQNAS